MFIGGLGANFEYDLKKIISLSALRQLGPIGRSIRPKLGYVETPFRSR